MSVGRMSVSEGAKRRERGETDRRTDYGLGVVGAGGAEAEFAQVVFAFLGEGVESGFGGLWGIS